MELRPAKLFFKIRLVNLPVLVGAVLVSMALAVHADDAGKPEPESKTSRWRPFKTLFSKKPAAGAKLQADDKVRKSPDSKPAAEQPSGKKKRSRLFFKRKADRSARQAAVKTPSGSKTDAKDGANGIGEKKKSSVPGTRKSGAARADQFVITKNFVGFYKKGPMQQRKPDEELLNGTLVTVMRMRKGWTDVRLKSGEEGCVSTDFLRKAMASDFPVEEIAVAVIPISRGDELAARGGGMDDVLGVPVAPPPLPTASDVDGDDDGVGAGLLATPMLLLPLDDEPAEP